MPGKRWRDAGERTRARLKDTVTRLVCFRIVTRTRRGRTKTAAIRVLITLLDPLPSRQRIAAFYAASWPVETAFSHLKKTVRGTGREQRGRSAALARQEAWALLFVHDMIAAMAARARFPRRSRVHIGPPATARGRDNRQRLIPRSRGWRN